MAEKAKRNIKLIIAYDGTRFSGWQRQGNTENTLQALVESAASSAVGETVDLIGASRTDAGVHANGQTANFLTGSKLSSADLLKKMNEILPADVAVLSAADMPERFHARYNATGKIYRYHIRNAAVQNPFTRKYSCHVPETLNLPAMQEAVTLLAGKRDFKAFSTGKTKKSTVKTLTDITVSRENDDVVITFRGDSFLYNMARILTGTILECGMGKRKPDSIPAIFDANSRAEAGFTAPAHGLFLDAVYYE